MNGRGAEWSRVAGMGFLGGFAVGLLVWGAQVQRSRRELFSPSAWRRFAALGYLGGHPGVDTARLLTEYVQWEARPVLRKRGQHLLRRMKTYLD